MKKFIALACLVATATTTWAGVIALEGTYQQKNIYVSNSMAGSGAGFCTYEIVVNGDISTDEVQSSAFEIDLSIYELDFGDEVVIQIKHKDGCTPKVLNPDVLTPLPTFETVSINLTSDGALTWTTEGEDGKLPFVIQQYKWSKWVNVGEVDGMGTSEKHNYEFKVTFVSGVNKFRVIQRSHDGKVLNTPTVTHTATEPKLTHIYNKKTEMIEFSDETAYEIYDVYGQIKKKGFGRNVDVSNLEKDDYYVSFDSSTVDFEKK